MTAKTNDQIKNDIFKFIKANGIMTLGTSYSNKPWLCTVYYGVDKDMNLYIVTDPNSIHGKNISKNPNVAFNIFDSRQKIFKSKKGVQGFGTIEILKGIPAITKALYLWHKQNPGVEKAITIKEVKKFADTKVWKITPKYMKFFNKVLYSPQEYGIWEA
jgi:uncharacterized protein YhbP (UPF0306 family)